jgi:hypothetical protein
MTNPSPSTEEPIIAGEQTQFGTEAWLYDANKSVPVEKDPSKIKPSFWKTTHGKLVILGGAVVIALILMLVTAVVMRNRQVEAPPAIIDQTPAINMNLGPLGDKVKALNLELKAADPTKELDPFPPVNLDARLDPATR